MSSSSRQRSFVPCGHPGPLHHRAQSLSQTMSSSASLMLGHFQICASSSQWEKERKYIRASLTSQERPGSRTHHVCQYLMSENSVTWPHLTARETGKYNLDESCAQPQLHFYVRRRGCILAIDCQFP